MNIKNFACDVCGYQVYKKVCCLKTFLSFQIDQRFSSGRTRRSLSQSFQSKFSFLFYQFNLLKLAIQIRNHFCHLCTASFITRRALNQHFTKHKDKYDCVCGVNGCTSAFKSKDTLKQHQNEIHFKVHRHFCSECGKGFYRLSKMKQHQQSHFQPDPALAANCPECNKVFKNSQSMKSHLKNYHGEKKGTDCQYCGTTFSKNYFLKRHILTVHMKQKITCQVAGCQKTFVRHEQYKSKLQILNLK